jgi:hypothetical protein
MARPDERSAERTQPAIWELLVLVAGLAVGLWLGAEGLREFDSARFDSWLFQIGVVLGGLSLAGPPLLIAERRRRGRPWRAGRLLWFAQGMASWLLWPPMIWARARGDRLGSASICYFYGTPLMAVYITLALLAGGWLRPGRRRRRLIPWRERFGILLGLAWACLGFYLLFLIYFGFPGGGVEGKAQPVETRKN